MGLYPSKPPLEGPSPHGTVAGPASPGASLTKHQHARQASIRVKSKQPMPAPGELEQRFAKVLVSEKQNRDLIDVNALHPLVYILNVYFINQCVKRMNESHVCSLIIAIFRYHAIGVFMLL